MNLVRKEERRGPKTWPKGTNRDRGEGSLIVGVRREEVDDHIVYVYGVYIHREYIMVTAV